MFKEDNTTSYYEDGDHESQMHHYPGNEVGNIREYRKQNSPLLRFLVEKKYYIALIGVLVAICLVLLIALIVYNVMSRDIIINDDKKKNTVIMVSIDGFRPDYLELFKADCPHLTSIYGKGVKAKSMKPIFPSKTFPNHYTLVTGLYAESHGIVSNSFYDPNFNAKFSLGSEESLKSRWWLGEPIWVTAEKQGVVSGSFFWPGSDVDIQGMYPTYYRKYDGDVDYETRVKTVFEWLDSDKPPQMVLTYFSAVDSTGHKYGPHYSEQLRESVKLVDDSIGLLLQELEKRNMTEKVDLIIVSDHGMSYTPESKIVRMTDILGRNVLSSDIFSMNDGPFFDLYVKDKSMVEPLYNELVASINGNGTFSEAIEGVYLKRNMPERFHFVNSDRIPDIIVLAKPEFSILRYSTSTLFGNGNHGYDNESPDMGSLFIAQGKHFKKGFNSETQVKNLDVYTLLCELLALTPAPNNGTAQAFKDFLI